MRNMLRPAGALLLVTLAMAMAMAACGGQAPTATGTGPAPAPSPSPSPSRLSATPAETAAGRPPGPDRSDIPWNGSGDPYNAVVALDDGRRVAMHYRRGEGLYEQHSGPRDGGWTRPRLVYGTKTEACQGIRLRAFGETVAATADFGPYCSDGEPPMESVAAVAVGDLREWHHHLTRSFDGWERVSASQDGRTITFRRGSTTLRWTVSGGFTK
ncbi:hypothetical protein [Sphaerisporangium sp. TRM90804]|uniref:hypothetical protein n=1 Tax=Sphaerisporangium sp. TRM90804 TaxID=3031113 RepID=UPI00244C6634|nr:hypothetical protein [Sphaerisporangium sp. TRM90804]MDH2426694.1 hypothetical protein [Sphaerisporangium sp. TRM90804]